MSSCGIGVHPQPSFGGYPTAITITTTLSAEASPVTSVVSMSAAMSIEILDATLINPAGDTWNVAWTDEVRDRIVEIANNFCGIPAKVKRQGGAGAMAPGAVDRITCDMRTLEAGQQEDFQAEVTQEVLENVVVDAPAVVVEDFATTGLTTLQIQRLAAGAVGLAITGLIITGSGFVGTSGGVKKADVLENVAKVTAQITPSTTSTTSTATSSSSSSSTSQICPFCTGCVLVALNDEEGQIGASLPQWASVVSTTTTAAYRCQNGAAPQETITFNQGPWCNCPEGRFSTSQSIITSGSETLTDNCPYTTAPPVESIWSARPYNLRSVSCDAQHGDKYGMVKDDFLDNVVSYCSSASKQSWNILAQARPATRSDKAYRHGSSRLEELSKPTNRAFALYKQKHLEQWPMDVSKGDKMMMAFQVKYDVNACDDPKKPTLVDFVVEDWCNIQFQPIYDYHQCGYTYHIMDSTRASLFYSGGKVYSDCMSWEIFMVGRDQKRSSEILADKEAGPKLIGVGGKFFNSTGLYSNSTDSNSTIWDDDVEEGSSDGWSSTIFSPEAYWGLSEDD